MSIVWISSLLSVLIISLVSLVGLFTLGIKVERLKKILIYFISFSAGALFGDAFFHLLPQLTKTGFTFSISFFILVGILIFLLLEKVVHWQHCHMPISKTHIHPFAYMNLVGDSLHNFLDGIIIASAYIISIPAGIATSIAVLLHEIPQEIGDFGVLLHGGFSKTKALMLNFLTALIAFLGVAAVFLLNNFLANIEVILASIAVGGFIYIAGSDLIPELHKETQLKSSILQILFFILGVVIMAALLLLE
jgi:zinc and cadmium transporter